MAEPTSKHAMGKDSPITVGLLIIICAGVIYVSTMLTNMQRDINDLRTYQAGSWTMFHQQIWLEDARTSNPNIKWPTVSDTVRTLEAIQRR